MNPTLKAGTAVVTIALIFYSIAILKEQRKKEINRTIIFFLTFGIISDITATILMIIGSHHIPVTVHGIIGYSALLAMLIETILIWQIWRKKETVVPRSVHLYTRFAYIWWVLAFLAGGFIAMFHLY